MRRIAASLLVLTMALTLLSACGGNQRKVFGTIDPNPDPGVEDVPAGTIEPGSGEPSTPAGTIESAPEETQESDVSLGRMEGGVYTNTYAGFGCTLDSNWEFYTAEELQEMPENLQEMFADTEAGEAFSSITQIMDMQAENANDLTSINVLYQKLDAATRLEAALCTEEELLDSMLETMTDFMVSTYEQAGFNVISLEKAEVEFLGEKHFALHMKAEASGIPYYTLQLLNYQAGRYGVITTLASYLEDKTDSLLELFYPVD